MGARVPLTVLDKAPQLVREYYARIERSARAGIVPVVALRAALRAMRVALHRNLSVLEMLTDARVAAFRAMNFTIRQRGREK